MRERLFPLLSRLALTCLGALAAPFCLVSAFSLPVDAAALAWGLVLLAVLLWGAWSLPRYRAAALAGLGLLYGFLLWQRFRELLSGVLALSNRVLQIYVVRVPLAPQEIRVPEMTAPEEEAAVTLALLALMALVTLFLARSAVRGRSFLPPLLLTAPFLAVPMFVVYEPHWLAITLLLLYWVGSLISLRLRGTAPEAEGAFLWLVLAAVFCLTVGLRALSPQEGYEHAYWADVVRDRLYSSLSDSYQPGGLLQGRGSVAWSTGGGNANLSSCGPLNLTPRTVLQVESDTREKLYLRGFSAGRYTTVSWSQFYSSAYLDQDYSEIQPLGLPSFTKIREIVDTTPPYASTLTLELPGVNTRTVTVNNVGADPAYCYTPYQLVTVPTYIQDGVPVRDSYLEPLNRGEPATFTFVRETSPQLNEPLYEEARQAEERYREFVNRAYTALPDSTREAVLPLCEEAGLTDYDPNSQRFELSQAVADYVRGAARYDPNTGYPPKNADVVVWFLTQSRRGYCVHFASSAAVLLQAMGVPARFVSGYVADPARRNMAGVISVPGTAAHAWVEVYYDGYGWEPLEVTPGYSPPSTSPGQETPAPERTGPPEATPTVPATPNWIENNNISQNPRPSGEVYWVLGGLLLALLLPLLALGPLLRRRILVRRRLRRLHSKDYSRAAIGAYVYLEALAPYGVRPTPRATELAQKAMYSTHPLTREEARKVADEALEEARQIDASLPWRRRWVFRYWRGLY